MFVHLPHLFSPLHLIFRRLHYVVCQCLGRVSRAGVYLVTRYRGVAVTLGSLRRRTIVSFAFRTSCVPFPLWRVVLVLTKSILDGEECHLRETIHVIYFRKTVEFRATSERSGEMFKEHETVGRVTSFLNTESRCTELTALLQPRIGWLNKCYSGVSHFRCVVLAQQKLGS